MATHRPLWSDDMEDRYILSLTDLESYSCQLLNCSVLTATPERHGTFGRLRIEIIKLCCSYVAG